MEVEVELGRNKHVGSGLPSLALDKNQESHGYISGNLLLFDLYSTSIVISVYIAQDQMCI